MSTNAVEAIQTLEDFLRTLIKKHPNVRNDYRLMVCYVWFYQTGNHSFTQFSKRQLQMMSSPTSITRAYRALKEREPEYGPDEPVASLREEREEELTDFYGRPIA